MLEIHERRSVNHGVGAKTCLPSWLFEVTSFGNRLDITILFCISGMCLTGFSLEPIRETENSAGKNNEECVEDGKPKSHQTWLGNGEKNCNFP